MGLGDFSGYVETQPKALMADLSAEEWLEQVFQHSGRYWGARIGDAEFELTSSGKGRDLDRRTLRSMSKSIAEQIGKQLRNPGTIADDRLGEIETSLDVPIRID